MSAPDDRALPIPTVGPLRRFLRRLHLRVAVSRQSVRGFPSRFGAWLRFQLRRRSYCFVDGAELARRRRSDTVFVFGSGWSLNEIPPDEWARIEQHDTFGFNWFVRQRYVRCDFQLIRGIPDSDLRGSWRPQVEEYFRLLAESPFFSDAALLIQTGFRATNGNRAIGYRFVVRERAILLWRSLVPLHCATHEPSRSFKAGLTHGHSALQETVNAAYLLGWKNIVLVGVDLYDRRYFWLDHDDSRSLDVQRSSAVEDVHNRAASGMIEELGAWARTFAAQGVTLSVHNPRSLLAAALPVYEWPVAEGDNG